MKYSLHLAFILNISIKHIYILDRLYFIQYVKYFVKNRGISMDLTFSEIDNNDSGGYPNESYANINSDRYWEAPPTPIQPAVKPEKRESHLMILCVI